MTQKELAIEIERWFSSKTSNNNRWNDNPVGKVIYKYLNSFGNWKNAGRGNPRKGGYARQQQKQERGY